MLVGDDPLELLILLTTQKNAATNLGRFTLEAQVLAEDWRTDHNKKPPAFGTRHAEPE